MSTLAATPAVTPLYAGFWRRGAAYLLDSVIVLVPTLLLAFALDEREMLMYASTIIIACAYYAGFHSSSAQATLGKQVFGIKVADLQGGRISLARAVGRYFATSLSALMLLIGYLMAAFTGKRQALHDMIAGTLVVNKGAAPADVTAGGGVMRVTAGVWIAIVVVMIIPFFGGILAAIAIPAYQDTLVRSRIWEVFNSAAPLKSDIERALAEKRPLPVGPASIGSKYVHGAMVGRDGQIVITLAPELREGGRLVLTPSMDASGKVWWECSGENVPPKYWPAACRNRNLMP